MEWELSKENVQPTKTGRNVDVLNEALKAKAEGPARFSIFEHQRRQLLEAIENYVGEDPLQPWIRCIKWIKDAFPAGGAQSELVKLLERCTQKFLEGGLYHRDLRYLRVWIQYADCCTDPSDIFAFLEANEIGQDHAIFYEAYATSMEVRRNFSKADEIYQLGLRRSAQPVGRLENMYKSFLTRMLRRGERKIREEEERAGMGFGDYENDGQIRSFGPRGEAIFQQSQRHGPRPNSLPPSHPQSSRPESAKLSVFVDPEFQSLPKASEEVCGKDPMPFATEVACWHHLASDGDRKKENMQQPSKWSDVKIKQKTRGQPGGPRDLNIFVDEEFVEETNLKPLAATSKSSSTLRMRLEDMQNSRRHSSGLKGSSLELSESYRLPGPLCTGNYQSEIASVAAKRAAGDLVLGYDTSLVNESGTERSFEEVRWSTWKEKSQLEQLENLPRNIIEAEKFEDEQSSLLSDINESFDMARELHLSPKLEDVTENIIDEVNVGLWTVSSGRNVDNHSLNHRENPLLQCSSQQGDNKCLTACGFPTVQLLSSELAAKEDDLTVCKLQPQTVPHPSSQEQGAYVDINASNSFTIQGDETVAIKRFAEEVIVLGADPKLNSIEAVSHHGLVEPTINTKEALADILDMFNKPLECDNLRSKSRFPQNPKNLSNNLLAKSSGFQVFVDEDLDMQVHAKPNGNGKGFKASSTNCSAPVVETGGCHIFADEHLDVQRSFNTDKNGKKSKVDPVDCSAGFFVFEDDDLHEQRYDHFDGDGGNADLSSQSFVDHADWSNVLNIYQDEDLDACSPSNPKNERSAKASNALDPVLESRSFRILADEKLNVEKPAVVHQQQETTGEASVHPVFQVDDFEELSINSDGLDGNSIAECPQHQSCLFDENEISKRVSETDSGGDQEVWTTSGSVPCTEAVLNRATFPLQTKLLEVNFADDRSSASPGRHLSPDIHESPELTIDGTTNSLRTEEISGKESTEMVAKMANPWDENNLQELLMRVNGHLPDYEGFFGSSEKYSGTISISLLRGSNVRNKILQLGPCTYRLKGCVGRGAFAQVFEAEDEDEEFFDDAPKLALKFQKPACPWEFYIYRQLDMRISDADRHCYGYVRRFHMYSDCSFMVCDYGEKGTLQDVVNAYLSMGQRMDEILCMFYTIEMLRLLEVLHGVGIIHGDFKPDNLLIRDYHDSEELEAWAPDQPGFWKSQGLSLIDWGRSIDITLYPEGIQFNGDCKTDSFRCPEMLENRPWTFQVDTFGLCGVVHCLLHGNYMQIEKIKTGDGQTIYRPKDPYRRYWNIELWRNFFETLLNVQVSRHNSPLISLRQSFEAHLSYNAMGKKLKALLAKQRIMMFTRS